MTGTVQLIKLNTKLTRLEKIGDKYCTMNGFKSVEAYHAEMNNVRAEIAKLSPVVETAQAETEEEKRANKIDRARNAGRNDMNAFLRQEGYKWQKESWGDPYQEYGDGGWEWVLWEWVLRSADGRAVTIEQAFDEIKRGVDVVLAEIAEAEAKATAEAEAEEKAKVEEQDEQAEAEAKFDTAVSKSTDGLTRTSDRFNIDALEKVAHHGMRTLLIGEVNGQRVAVVETAMYDGEFYTYWSERGEPATPSVLDDLFG